MQEHGVGDTRQVWQAEAAAERKDREKWAMSIGEFSHTIKGRHAAEKTCTRWMDQATKRIKGAK